jgi:hypothetical protein
MNGQRRQPSRWDTFNEWTIRAGFMLAGAHLGIPGLGKIAGAALHHGSAFTAETLAIVLNPGETPEVARARIEQALTARGIRTDTGRWLFDDASNELSFTVLSDQADAAAEMLGNIDWLW